METLATTMLGTKLLLLSFVVCVPGQGVSIYGSLDGQTPYPPVPITRAPENLPRTIYSPIPLQPAPRTRNGYPRPLQPWARKSIQTTVAPAENITPVVNENVQLVYPESSSAPQSYVWKAVDLESEIESTPKPAPIEEPVVVLHPEAENVLPLLPADASSDITINPQPERVPEPSEPSLPSSPRPLPTLESVISLEPKPVTPEPVIPSSQPEPIVLQPNDQPLEPLKPVEAVPVYLPPMPNYLPIPDEPVIPSTSPPLSTLMPYESRPNYQPPSPLAPIPISEIPNPPPLPTYTYTSQPPPQQTTSHPNVITTINVPLVNPEIISIIPLSDFECRKGNGYYTIVNECDTYIECQSQGVFKHTCPDGLHFNPQALYSEYPCAYPSEVQCENTASKQIARPTKQCPNQYGFFPISEGDCSKYLVCQEGMATLLNCPFGLVFNEHISSCDWPENVPQCKSNVFKDFTCPTPSVDDPDVLTKFRYGSDCGMYVACHRGHPRLLRCDAGLSFDQNSQVCIDSDLVTSCRIPMPLLIG